MSPHEGRSCKWSGRLAPRTAAALPHHDLTRVDKCIYSGVATATCIMHTRTRPHAICGGSAKGERSARPADRRRDRASPQPMTRTYREVKQTQREARVANHPECIRRSAFHRHVSPRDDEARGGDISGAIRLCHVCPAAWQRKQKQRQPQGDGRRGADVVVVLGETRRGRALLGRPGADGASGRSEAKSRTHLQRKAKHAIE